MSFKDYYEKSKETNKAVEAVAFVLGLLIIIGTIYVGNLCWNVIGVKLGAPHLTFLEFLCGLILAKIIKVALIKN